MTMFAVCVVTGHPCGTDTTDGRACPSTNGVCVNGVARAIKVTAPTDAERDLQGRLHWCEEEINRLEEKRDALTHELADLTADYDNKCSQAKTYKDALGAARREKDEAIKEWNRIAEGAQDLHEDYVTACSDRDAARQERDELRRAIFGGDYDPVLRNSNFVEMAKMTDDARAAAQGNAVRLAARVEALTAVATAAAEYRLAETDGTPRVWRGKTLQGLAAALDEAIRKAFGEPVP